MHPTQYPDVNSVLETLLSNVRGILGDGFVGLYLYGSLSSGDFDPDRSDVDFVVVTTQQVSGQAFCALDKMHARLAADSSKWFRKLEGAYIPQRSIARYDPSDLPHPFLNEGVFRFEHLGSDWIIQRFIIREQGSVVAGPDPKTLIDPIQSEDLTKAVRGVLREWWVPQLKDASLFRRRDYQAYAVLTMCRALYTIQHCTVASKPVSAEWAGKTVGEPWRPLIERAASWRQDDGVNDLDDTLAFIRYALRQILGEEIGVHRW